MKIHRRAERRKKKEGLTKKDLGVIHKISKSNPSLIDNPEEDEGDVDDESDEEYDRNGVYVGRQISAPAASPVHQEEGQACENICSLFESLPQREFIEEGYNPVTDATDHPRQASLTLTSVSVNKPSGVKSVETALLSTDPTTQEQTIGPARAKLRFSMLARCALIAVSVTNKAAGADTSAPQAAAVKSVIVEKASEKTSTVGSKTAPKIRVSSSASNSLKSMLFQ